MFLLLLLSVLLHLALEHEDKNGKNKENNGCISDGVDDAGSYSLDDGVTFSLWGAGSEADARYFGTNIVLNVDNGYGSHED